MTFDDARTRRSVLAAGSAVAGGLLAGCTSGPGSSDGNASGDGSDGGSATTTAADGNGAEGGDGSDDGGDGGSSESGPYSVSMVPVGEVEFDAVPETWVANNGSWADMGVALGLEPPKGVWLTSRYHTQYYDAVPGVSVDKSDMVSLWQDGVSKELFYEFDADVHVMDPNFLVNRFKGWKQADVDEIEKNVAPFFGNCIYAQHYPWHADYRYYTLMEGFEKLAQVFKRMDRYEAFVGVREEFQSRVSSVVPAESERPSVGVLWGSGEQPEQFYPFIIGGGTAFTHLRDLGVRDALANTDVKDFYGSRAAIDLETVLEVDPPVLLLRGYEGMTRDEFENTIVSFLENHETARQLTAVENGDVYRSGGLYLGPITNMVLTERLAGDLYGADDELFDRDRVAAIVQGDV